MKNITLLLFLLLSTQIQAQNCETIFQKAEWNLTACLDNTMFAIDKGNHVIITSNSNNVKITAFYNATKAAPKDLWKTNCDEKRPAGLSPALTQAMVGVANNYDRYTVHRKWVNAKDQTYAKAMAESIITYKDQYYILTSSDNSPTYSEAALEFLDRVVKKLSFSGEGQLINSQTQVSTSQNIGADRISVVEVRVPSSNNTTNTNTSTNSTSTSQNIGADRISVVEVPVSSSNTTTNASAQQEKITAKPVVSGQKKDNFIYALKKSFKDSNNDFNIMVSEAKLRANTAEEAQMEIDDFKPTLERWKRSVSYSLSQLRKCTSTTVVTSNLTKRSDDPYAPIQYYDGEIVIDCDGEQKHYSLTCIDINGKLYVARMYIPRKK